MRSEHLTSNIQRPILISGIQPSGRLHLGNYLGALKNFVDLQNSGEYDCYFFIADLHSLTEEFEPQSKRKQILELTADYLAAGLDPKKSVIFQQSQIPAHSELAFILNTIMPYGELQQMTQFKEKAGLEEFKEKTKKFVEDFKIQTKKIMADPKKMEILKESKLNGVPMSTSYKIKKMLENNIDNFEKFMKNQYGKRLSNVNTGLLTYPTLMAADILLYDAKFVPVGEDQLQHLELTRTLARKFNAKFPAPRSLGEGRGKTFIEPQPLLTKSPRVMSLGDPAKKMSKSLPQTCLFLEDSPEEIKSKIKRAVTDSGNEVKLDQNKKPGLSNLLNIYSALSEKPIAKIEKEFIGKNYGDFKFALADLIIEKLSGYQKTKKRLLTSNLSLLTTLNSGSKIANGLASKKIAEVKSKLGLNI